jgi:basic amino acid/polyamine antiporter, APA family
MTAKKISGITATNLVIANMVGTGVFTSLGFQISSIPSDFALLALWVVGGIAALCGALCYTELAVALPRSGGEYNFLSRIYHPSIGFLAGWISALVGFAGPIALAGLAFGKYFDGVIPGVPQELLALGICWFITAIHLFGVRIGEWFQNISTFIKFGLIFVLVVAGIFFVHSQPLDFDPGPQAFKTLASVPFAVSLIYVMYSYSGWNAATYITEDIRDPAKNLPRALLTGTIGVLVLYVVLNYVFLATTPKQAMSGQVEVGLIVGGSIFGEVGGRIVSGLISFGLLATISAMTFIGPRITKRIAEDLPKLLIFGKTTKSGIPWVGLLFQILLVTIFIKSGTFETVLVYTQFSLLLCPFLSVMGLIVLRIREPRLERPYKVWAYPITPIIFMVITLWMMISVIMERPAQSVLGLITVVAGLTIYFFSKESGRSVPSKSQNRIKG